MWELWSMLMRRATLLSSMHLLPEVSQCLTAMNPTTHHDLSEEKESWMNDDLRLSELWSNGQPGLKKLLLIKNSKRVGIWSFFYLSIYPQVSYEIRLFRLRLNNINRLLKIRGDEKKMHKRLENVSFFEKFILTLQTFSAIFSPDGKKIWTEITEKNGTDASTLFAIMSGKNVFRPGFLLPGRSSM